MKASVELYVRRGYDVNATDIRGRTLLLLAAGGGHADICRLLIEAGADPSLRDVNGLDALSAAVQSKKEKAAAVLRTCLSAAAVSLGDPAAEHSSTAGVVSEAGVAIAAGEDEIRNLADWEELIESPPPPDNQSLLLDARELQNRISRHASVNRDEDWSDIDIDMPDVADRDSLDHVAWLEEVRDLIHLGLSCGWVTKPHLAELVRNYGDEQKATDIEARLRFVLGDVGIPVEDDYWAWEAVAASGLRYDSQYDELGDRIVEDAITFLGDLSRGNDHLAHYYKDIKQIEAATLQVLHVAPRGRPAPSQKSR